MTQSKKDTCRDSTSTNEEEHTGQPISSMGIVFASSGADVDHVLHPPGDVLLHLEGHGQRLSHPAPSVSLLDRLDWTRAKEVIVCRSPGKSQPYILFWVSIFYTSCEDS